MYAFNYHRPRSLSEAAGILSRSADSRPLAGGQTLLPTLKQRLTSVSDVVDLGALAELKGIAVSGSSVTIGATTRHAEVARSGDVARAIRALAVLAAGIGDPQVRNMGTIGGSVANNDPAADYPSAVLALDATIHTNKRTIRADEFFKGMFETALNAGEIITKIEFPIPKRAGYAKFPNPASRYAIVGVFVAETSRGVRVAVTGAGPSVFRAQGIEAALAGRFDPASIEKAEVPAAGLNADMHASADYRAHLIKVMAKRAVKAALA
jgi:aerobic carbon-monoxide dehydrogenase medium subunit